MSDPGDAAGRAGPRDHDRLAGTAAAVGLAASAVRDPARLEADDRAWDAFVAGLPTPSFTQVTAWARVKRPNGWTPARIAVDGGTAGPIGAQVLLRRAPGLPWALGYAARGPLGQAVDADALSAFSEAARSHGRALRVSHLRIEPEFERDAGIETALARAGWRRQARSLQPPVTRLIDLTRPEEALWSELRPKWRQYVNKARRGGVRISPAGFGELPAFYRLYEETASRAGFIQREEHSYQAVWDAFAPAGMARLLFARAADGTPLATLFLVGCGRRMTELYGGMSVAGADAHANYLLKWEAITRARDEGFAEYDLWGLASAGIAHFKAGFGGREVAYVGSWELVLDPVGRAVLESGRRVSMTVARAIAPLRRR